MPVCSTAWLRCDAGYPYRTQKRSGWIQVQLGSIHFEERCSNAMKKKRALSASRDSDVVYEFHDPEAEPNSLSLVIDQTHEMLKITKTGFYVRGQLVPQDEREAEMVYNAFREFLTYHSIAREYS